MTARPPLIVDDDLPESPRRRARGRARRRRLLRKPYGGKTLLSKLREVV